MKKILLSLLLCLPLSLMAQQKIAVVNAQEVLTQMTEFKAAQVTLQELAKKYDNDLKAMQDELQKKSDTFIKEKDSLSELLQKNRQSELQDMYARIEQSRQTMEEDMRKQQEKMVAPIHQKLMETIKKLGDEKGYAYILDISASLYNGTGAIDCTADLKAKLGIK